MGLIDLEKGKAIVSGMLSSVSARATKDDTVKLSKNVTVVKEGGTDEKMASNARKCRKWVSDHPTGIVCFFASWCGHCQTMLKSLPETMLSEPDVNMLLIDGDVVSNDIKRGDTSLCGDIRYFPSIFCIINGTVEEAQNIHEAIEKTKQEPKGDSLRKLCE